MKPSILFNGWPDHLDMLRTIASSFVIYPELNAIQKKTLSMKALERKTGDVLIH